jgi:hypothetical protein
MYEMAVKAEHPLFETANTELRPRRMNGRMPTCARAA